MDCEVQRETLATTPTSKTDGDLIVNKHWKASSSTEKPIAFINKIKASPVCYYSYH